MFAIGTQRRIAVAALALASVANLGSAQMANQADTAGRQTRTAGQRSPLWAQRPLVSSSRAPVAKVVTTATADVVLLGSGHNEGFRDGMACEVYRGDELIAELMIVHCETERSAALITALKAGMGIAPGDVANIKTVHPF